MSPAGDLSSCSVVLGPTVERSPSGSTLQIQRRGPRPPNPERVQHLTSAVAAAKSFQQLGLVPQTIFIAAAEAAAAALRRQQQADTGAFRQVQLQFGRRQELQLPPPPSPPPAVEPLADAQQQREQQLRVQELEGQLQHLRQALQRATQQTAALEQQLQQQRQLAQERTGSFQELSSQMAESLEAQERYKELVQECEALIHLQQDLENLQHQRQLAELSAGTAAPAAEPAPAPSKQVPLYLYTLLYYTYIPAIYLYTCYIPT